MAETYKILMIGSDAVGPILDDPVVREHLRSDMHRGIEHINRLIAEGKHITRLRACYELSAAT